MIRSPYAISRQPVHASRGIVATSQPLASQAGLSVLQSGGNAIDAAIATAAALTVLEPTSNGIGGDAFAIVHTPDGELHGYNGSGRSPQTFDPASPDLVQADGTVPARGWAPVTTPGAPRCWVDLHDRFGRLSLTEVLAPAIHHARHGFPLSPVVAQYWQRAIDLFGSFSQPEFTPWKGLFCPDGFVPKPGARWRSDSHAQTLEAIARSKAEEFYQGALAKQIDSFSKQTGGRLRFEDMASHHGEWVAPLSARYRGHEVWELPPNTQAIATLQALNILDGFELPPHRETAEGLHLQVEAMKLAFADALAYVGEPDTSPISAEQLLAEDYTRQRRELIGATAAVPTPGVPPSSDTVYLCSADADGMMVSFIQSNYMGFGSGIVVPGTGIALQNRGHNFTTQAGHPNEAKPGKRPYHTIMPGFLTRQGKAVGPFGVMAGTMQPQGHLQLVLNTIDYQLNPQEALDAPRWRWSRGRTVHVEQRMPEHVIDQLAARGHDVRIDTEVAPFGRGQIIWKDKDGALTAGSDSRADGCAAAY